MQQMAKQNWENENWAAWQERYHLQKPECPFIPDRIEILNSRTGMPTVRVLSPNGRSVFLHSSGDPVREAQRTAVNLTIEPGTALIVYGFGLGYLIEALLKSVDEKIALFVVEPDRELFCTAMKTRDLRSVLTSDRVYILVGDSPEEFEKSFGIFYVPARNREIVTTGLPGHSTVYAGFKEAIAKRVADVLRAHKVELATMMKIGPDVIASGILNLIDYYTLPGVRTLFEQFPHVPAIVVAAGPSLNKNIHLLREAKGKAIILAVGTAVRALQQRGIDPDFVISIDPGLPNYEIFKKINTERTCLITEMQSHHFIVKEFQGPKFVMGKTLIMAWYDDLIEDKGMTATGGSVANNAVSAAYQMGADPIILVGQDLAYSKDGHSHAAGTNYENNVINGEKQRGFLWVKANDGGEVRTDAVYYQFLKWFERWFKRFPDREYINATEGGALIEGTAVMTLRKVIDRYCTSPVDVKQVIAKAQQSFAVPSLVPLVERLRTQKHVLDKALKDTARAMKRLNKLEQACESRQAAAIQKHLSAVRRIYEQFSNDPFLSVLPDWLARQEVHGVMSRTYRAEQEEKDDFHDAIADYTLYYEKMRTAVKTVGELIHTCMQEAERRMDDDEQSVRKLQTDAGGDGQSGQTPAVAVRGSFKKLEASQRKH